MRGGPDVDLWFERCETVRLNGHSGGGAAVRVTRYRGLGETARSGGDTTYRWAHVRAREDLAALTPPWFHAGLDEVAAPWPAQPDALAAQRAVFDGAARCCAELGWSGTALRLRHVDQLVVQGRAGVRREDRRRHVSISLQTVVPDPSGEGGPMLRREVGTGEPDDPAWGAAVDALVVTLDAQWGRADVEAVQAGEWPVVLAPGHCGLFFHELCGHPLEGDVVASGTSYLGSLLGRQVGPDCLTVHDDVSSPHSSVRYALDDEGVPPTTVALVEAGVVTEPILDRASAAALRRRANGRGRRLSYRHPAIPRQAHIAVATGAGDASSLVAGIRYGLLVLRLRLRHVSIATGDFSFYVDEGRVVRHGEIGPPAGACLLRGNGRAALERVEAVGADVEGYLGGGGCGKLDQGPLVVSFEQPSVRIAALRLTPGHR